MTVCKACGREIGRDEIGLHKKLVNRGAQEFLCIHCLARHFQVEEELLQQKIEEFKRDGCLLFR